MADDVADWLAGLGLAEYARAFADNHIDLALLPDLGDDDLKALGVASLGHRKRLLAAASRLQAPAMPATPAAPPGRPAARTQPQRRQAVVVFADLCGFTELSRGIDPEDLRRLVERFYARCDSVIVEAGGTVDKHLGDGIMAIFGAPVAHGDDTLRALRAAQAMHAAMAPLGDELGRPVQVHIGIATGEVVAGAIGGEQHYTVLGDAVNLASRLVGAAGPRETVVDDGVHRIAGDVARFEALGERAIKGIDKPVPLWRLIDVDATRAGSAAPFVGRAAERAQLEAALQAAVRERRGRFVLLRGEPGIGKTRLVEEVTHAAFALGATVHTAHALDFGGRQGGVIRQLLRALAIAPARRRRAHCRRMRRAAARRPGRRPRPRHAGDRRDRLADRRPAEASGRQPRRARPDGGACGRIGSARAGDRRPALGGCRDAGGDRAVGARRHRAADPPLRNVARRR